ncbi:trypsin-like serine protease [Saccharothrix sp. 6-C]|uniref:trypsin-like serine peptidase n=1 Tax=Saccharothrix sp. 6-C TaxID=2781735 RepID=UPI001916DFC8|nr:trypsin-like serine protease [Saccharothrix sp. 6-C]QQQ76411.1 trypsin-like serine protease [Saccharothrix sp. 6-C]
MIGKTFSALCLALTLTAVQASASTAAPALDPDTPVSDDGRVGAPVQRDPGGPRPTGRGFAGTGDLSDAAGVRRVTGPGPATVDPDDLSTQSIIAPDGRVQVTDTTTYPARATVRFTYTKPTGSTSWCTGWLYAANAVATAGHCVYNPAAAAWNTNFTVYPGRNGSSSPYGSCGVSNAYSVTGWTQDGSTEHDYAALKLTCTVGNTTGWFGLTTSTASLNGTTATTAGYPQDKPSGTQWTTSDTVTGTTARQLSYLMDTIGGQSGSAVYNTGCGTYCAVAVHAYGHTSHNRGTRIIEEVRRNLLAWAR